MKTKIKGVTKKLLPPKGSELKQLERLKELTKDALEGVKRSAEKAKEDKTRYRAYC